MNQVNSVYSIQKFNDIKFNMISHLSKTQINRPIYTYGDMVIDTVGPPNYYYKIKIYDYKEIQKDKDLIEIKENHILKKDKIEDGINISIISNYFRGTHRWCYFLDTVFHDAHCKCWFCPGYIYDTLKDPIRKATLEEEYNINIENPKYKNAISYIDSIEMRDLEPSPYRISLPDTSGNFIMVISKVKDA